MDQGDFSKLAKAYKARTGYSEALLKALSRYTASDAEGACVADVGAGTGKLTEQLLAMGLQCTAVEPNDEMRKEGIASTKNFPINWVAGSAEETTLEPGKYNWVTMASSFHWVKKESALKEFQRILRPGGFLTVMWNPRDLESDEFQLKIDRLVNSICPSIERVSSGAKAYTQTVEADLVSTGDFADVLFMEAKHTVKMTRERYMEAWRSVNDIQAQAGPEKWETILSSIEDSISDLDSITVSYKTRAWTVQRMT